MLRSVLAPSPSAWTGKPHTDDVVEKPQMLYEIADRVWNGVRVPSSAFPRVQCR